MPNPNQINKIEATKLILLVLIFCLFTYNMFFSKPVNKQNNLNPSTQEAIVSSLDKGRKDLRESKELLKKSGIYGEQIPLPGETPETPMTKIDAEKDVMCPQYIFPKLADLPRLPPKEVMDTVTQAQLNLILYQHIKSHQERTIETRERIFKSYVKYLESCE